MEPQPIKQTGFYDIFNDTAMIGMIHLAGGDNAVNRALDEIEVYRDEGLSGAIVENYHGSVKDVISTLSQLEKADPGIRIGINILPNEFELSFLLATLRNASFIQLDHVAGEYTRGKIASGKYATARQDHPNVCVLGGVWPKYYTPVPGSDLEADIREGMQRADAIVVTGDGTGKETPMDKIMAFRRTMGDFPLVVGAGLTPGNAYGQLMACDGAIVGSAFKPDGDTNAVVDRRRVHDLMDVVREVREKKAYHVIR